MQSEQLDLPMNRLLSSFKVVLSNTLFAPSVLMTLFRSGLCSITNEVEPKLSELPGGGCPLTTWVAFRK